MKQNALSITQLSQLMANRQSVGYLVEPAPSLEQLNIAIAAALLAPDHHRLRPWHFILIPTEHRQAFGECLAQCLAQEDIDSAQCEKVKQHPLRAPMILVCVMNYRFHAKVPHHELLLSCGAAIQNLLLSLEALGYASMWRTGDVANSAQVKKALGRAANDEIVGLIYIGTAAKKMLNRQSLSVADFLTTWQA